MSDTVQNEKLIAQLWLFIPSYHQKYVHIHVPMTPGITRTMTGNELGGMLEFLDGIDMSKTLGRLSVIKILLTL